MVGQERVHLLDDIRFEVDVDALLSRLRVSPDSKDAESLTGLIGQARATARPKAIYAECYVRKRTEETVEVDGAVLVSRVLRVNLDKVHRVFPFVATCGEELEHIRGVRGDPLKEYWLEEIKASALGSAVARVSEHIALNYRPGRMSSMSPGSLQDWPITQQKQLFSLLGDVEGAIGVRLTDSFLMVPLKSVSGIHFPTETTFESCQLCRREDCPGRRAPYDEHLWHTRYARRAPGPV
jgi:hypothetical protein